MKELDFFIISVVDLDIFKDFLLFSVIYKLRYGFFINGVFSKDFFRFKQLVNFNQKYEFVYNFFMEFFQNGILCFIFIYLLLLIY